MQMNDSQRIEAPKHKVWEALNDPEVLKASIPGCEDLIKLSDTELEAKVRLKVGPVKATFGGKVTLNDLDPPNGYTIEGEGSGGVAGFARGAAKVHLEEDGPDATILHYEVDAKVGGKLAQLGVRLIDSTAKRLAGEFFTAFGEQVAPGKPAATNEVEADTAPEDASPSGGEEKKGWIKGLFTGKKKQDVAGDEGKVDEPAE
ncbi:Carbon monoxide dehydrogenase subunit G (CoxG) [Labrenzia sp. THAF191b]|uniref:SRPBCC family protein n=1 Tax=unclassified Labrenzia TaxID=2648686 RepID=UPI0012A9BA48|nr:MULTISPECIES: carbon monoxide dehydrogenase subunit G [unclassified Labrenzia]QFS99847.1 Carbon monoxide dehydrogenase subunit G (CoxG) [Labrenzia sp. THAF191b]QFT06161.1 Carbon monoxide dehydrogenase subunit G (CoxG) [Labrenzia sp. THAF191a]QFT17705.1 Carbon monoxide dehydrogenase subunit G (CoxG) [Labrenzia sp. THAF187b]